MRLLAYFSSMLAIGLAMALPAAADALYTATDLGPNFSARAINNSGQIAGATFFPATYSAGAVTVLESTYPGAPTAINNSGQVVGWVIQVGLVTAFTYGSGTVAYLGPFTYPFAMNNSGIVVGGKYPYYNAPAMQPFSYSGGYFSLLNIPGVTYGEATGVNDAGQIVGWSSTANGQTLHAFLYSSGNLINIGVLPGGSASQANAINCKGQVVGDSLGSAASPFSTAFTYSNGVIASLGTLPGLPSSSAQAVNCTGQIVGSSWDPTGSQNRAFLYENGTMYDLNSLLSTDTT